MLAAASNVADFLLEWGDWLRDYLTSFDSTLAMMVPTPGPQLSIHVDYSCVVFSSRHKCDEVPTKIRLGNNFEALTIYGSSLDVVVGDLGTVDSEAAAASAE